MTASGDLALSVAGHDTRQLFGWLGITILVMALAHWAALRRGGWRFVRRRLRRELALTGAAFAQPVTASVRFRRRRRLLVRLLRERAVWDDAERASLLAGAVSERVRPFGVLVERDVVGVLVSCGPEVPVPGEPWAVDEVDPRLWWIGRDGLGAVEGTAPLLVAVGTEGEAVVFLDLLAGPRVVAVSGEQRGAGSTLQALAAQVDARLPVGAVTVADGVHPRFAGPAPQDAFARARAAAPSRRYPQVVVCATAPEVPVCSPVSVLTLGRVRGTARLLTVDEAGTLTVHGTPIRADCRPLARAVAATLRQLPPWPTEDAVRVVAQPSLIGDPDLDADVDDANADLDPPSGPDPVDPADGIDPDPRDPAPVPGAAHAEGAPPPASSPSPAADDDLAEPTTPSVDTRAGVSVGSPRR
jgi:hypothetical protein